MWASQCMFHRLGRALLCPLFWHQRVRLSVMTEELALALQWWLDALELRLGELRLWQPVATRRLTMLCDARSTPPRLAGVLFHEGRVLHSDWEPPCSVLAFLKKRGHGQIMSLELLAIAFGMAVTFLMHWTVSPWCVWCKACQCSRTRLKISTFTSTVTTKARKPQLRRGAPDALTIRAWCTPSGLERCCSACTWSFTASHRN